MRPAPNCEIRVESAAMCSSKPSGIVARCGLAAALLLAVAGCQWSRPFAPKRPNVIIYLIDTLRRDHLGVYGYERSTSPYIDAFAREAVTYADAFSTTAWTKPAVASVLTGLHPMRHAVQDRRHYVPANVPLLAEYLKTAGYETTGVITNPHAASQWGFGRGFDHYDETSEWEGRSADEVNDAVFFSLDRGRKPFFFYIHTIDVHGPEGPRVPYDKLFGGRPIGSILPKVNPGITPLLLNNAKALYDGVIRFNDFQFGRLVAKLKEMNVYDDTLIILVADHGEEHLDHGQGGHGKQLFNETVHIPMIVKYPKGRFAGVWASHRSSLLDVAPTVLAMAGVDVPDALEGIDLGHLPDGGESPAPERRLMLDLNHVRREGALCVARAIIDGPFKYIEDLLPEQKRMLFHLERDPGETVNLIDDDPSRAQEYSRLLDAYQASVEQEAVPQNLRESLKALGYLN